MNSYIKSIILVIVLLIVWFFLGTKEEEMKTVDFVDIEKFMGDWYVVANIPTYIEKNAVNAIESYTLNENGNIDINFTFSELNPNGEIKKYSAKGFIYNKESNAEWRVQFFWPIKFSYKVIYLDNNYKYTVVGVPNRKYLWIMSKEPEIEEVRYNEILEILKTKYNYDIKKIQLVKQEWDNDLRTKIIGNKVNG